MKKISLIFISLFLGHIISAQVIYTTPDNYQNLKQSGTLKPNARYELLNPVENTNHSSAPAHSAITLPTVASSTSTACHCIIPIDPTFSVVPMVGGSAPDYRNDDSYSASIPLGFNFCFYGSIYNSCFINNNGNITFNKSLFDFSSGGFPAGNPLNQDTIMIAPFWADVDTRGVGSGLVYYKQTPTAMIIKWSNVGYYNSMSDKINDFQLIITDGNDPLLPNGNNVAFCYGDMQWTTGSASQGINGFGGIPATVGVNKGDKTNYIQIGRFDKVGTTYDGPYGANDGISFLDNKSYFFNTCGTNNNLPPIVQDATGGGSVCGDTIRICALGDTLVYSTTFLAPEITQTVNIVGSAPTLGSNFQPLGVVTSTAGTTTFSWRVIATPSLTGVHTVVITGTDNGTPPLSSSATYYIKIQNVSIPLPTLSSSPNVPVCATPGATITLTNCSSYDNVYWSNGSSGCSMLATASGQYYVTVNKLGCYKSSSDSVTVYPNPIPVITGPLVYCNPATSTTLSLNPPLAGMPAYASFSWMPNAILTQTAALIGGPKTLNVVDVNGCTGSISFTVVSNTPTIGIVANPISICGVNATTLTATMLGATSYTWSNGTLTNTTSITTPGTYTVTGDANTCIATNTIDILFNLTPTITIPPTVGLCDGANATIPVTSFSPTGIYTYTWSNGSNSPSLVVGTTTVVTLEVTNITSGCKSLVSNSCSVIAVSNPTVSFTNSVVIFCNGSVATLSPSITGGSPNYNYTWTPSSLGSSSTATTNVNVGTFTVNITDQNLCSGSGTVSVIKSIPSISLSAPDILICPGECVRIKAIGNSAYGPGSFTWSNNTPNTSDTSFVCTAGSFSVSYIDAKGCAATQTLAVFNDAVPIASFNSTPPSPVVPDQAIDFTSTSTISSGSIASAVWSFGNGSGAIGNTVTYGYPTAGTFPVTLIVTGTNGCTDTISTIYQVDAILVVPNVVTPNGDKANDLLKFKNLDFYPTNDIVIFNRWGKKVYEQSNYKNDWDGSSFSDGTYFFILNVPDAAKKTYNGYFQLIH